MQHTQHTIGPIEHGVPIPPVAERACTLREIGMAMGVGDSRLMPYPEASSLRKTMYVCLPGSQWSMRAEGDLFRLWRKA